MLQAQERSDYEIQQDVLRELEWDSRVVVTEIGVVVHEGVVTLTGVVDSYLKKLAAEEAAHRVDRVRDVADQVAVRMPGAGEQSDADLAHAVRWVLQTVPALDHDLIHSTVSQGWVTLSGSVDRWQQRTAAEDAVRTLHGVLGITNLIGVGTAGLQEQIVRASIEAALTRSAARTASHINVNVDDSTVTVSGVVHSAHERRAVLGTASHVPGVTQVCDHLHVEPLP
jgi:osmotically-inducible protein OsmY